MRAMRSAFGVGAALARGVAFERNADGGGGGDIGGVDDVGRRALAPVAGVDQLQNAAGGDEAQSRQIEEPLGLGHLAVRELEAIAF